MSQQILQQPILVAVENLSMPRAWSSFRSYLPVILALVGPMVLIAARLKFGGDRFISDGAAMMLALAAYLIAAVFYLTNLYAPFRFAERLGMQAATLGVFFNLSSWLLRWAATYDRELAIFQSQGQGAADMPWLFRYVPFANLYDLSLAFAFGAGITTLVIMRRESFRVVAALSLPLAAIILVLARFIGSEIVDLPPVLDSYWRPIHVGIASLSYGTALVCFAVAVLYLLKDGLEVEKMAIWTSLFSLAVFGTISKFSIFSLSNFGTYTASTFTGTSKFALGLRVDIPYVGWLILAAAGLLLASIAANLYSIAKNDDGARLWGKRILWAALVVQTAGISMLVYQLRNLQDVVGNISSSQFTKFAVWMLQQQDMPQAQIKAMGQQQLYDMANNWITLNGSSLHLSLNANPVELAALITAFAGTFFVVLFGIKTERMRSLLPRAEVLDGLMYKIGGVTFAGLALLLITGAVWANESWGRYWGWDAKEVGALVAWLTYAGFLHSRIAYGWRGRRTAYFAVVAFLFVIFTYLGVSYLLPGLHSYA
jgi:ABC-type transport system involved in cytochrome c biogenesis permease subunit